MHGMRIRKEISIIGNIGEMIADWISVGKVLKNDWYNVIEWYEKNKKIMKLSPNTEQTINNLLIWYIHE
jgi:hypothetical protein